MSDFQVTGTIQIDDNASMALSSISSSAKDVVMGFSNLATSAFGLYSAYERVENAEVSLDRANLVVEKGTERVEQAQKTYNEAVEKYGVNSAEAKDAADKLAIAQDSLTVANERQDEAQRNVNDAMITSAMQVVPSAISMIGGLQNVYGTVKGALESYRETQETAAFAAEILAASEDVESVSLDGVAVSEDVAAVSADGLAVSEDAAAVSTGIFSGAMGVLTAIMDANPIVLVVLAIVAIGAALYAAYTYCAPFRDAVNAIGTALGNFFKPILDTVITNLTWLWNNVLVPLGTFIENTFVAAWKTLGNAISGVYNTFIKPVFDALQNAYNYILKPISDFFGGIASFLGFGGSTSTAPDHSAAKAQAQTQIDEFNSQIAALQQEQGSIPVDQYSAAMDFMQNNLGAAKANLAALGTGGIVMQPTYALVGEKGPEAIIPLNNYNGNSQSEPINLTVNTTNNFALGSNSSHDLIDEITRAIESGNTRLVNAINIALAETHRRRS